MLGTDFPYKQFLPKDAPIAQVDIRPENLGRWARLDLGIVGDVGATIEAVLPRLTPKPALMRPDHPGLDRWPTPPSPANVLNGMTIGSTATKRSRQCFDYSATLAA